MHPAFGHAHIKMACMLNPPSPPLPQGLERTPCAVRQALLRLYQRLQRRLVEDLEACGCPEPPICLQDPSVPLPMIKPEE